MPRLLGSLASLVIAASVPAQTFICDADNGPGTSFTTLEAAVAGVPDGATLIVRAGVYSPYPGAIVSGKGVTILGEPGAIAYVLTVAGQNANQPVTVHGLQIGGQFGGSLTLQYCQGPVHFEDCGGTPSTGSRLTIEYCAQVSMVRCRFRASPGSSFAQSDVVCVESQFQSNSGGAGLTVFAGRTQLAKCAVDAGMSGHPFQPGAAIVMNNGELRLLGPGTVVGGLAIPSIGPAISGTGNVRATANIGFTGTTIPFVLIDEGSTSSTSATVGNPVTGTLEGSANLLGGLLLGTTLAPLVIPGIAEELWVNPFGFMTIGGLGAPLSFVATVPNDPTLQGAVFGWQGMTWEPVAGFVLSNPAWFCVR